MEISKKKFVFYTIFLLILAGGITIAVAPPPEEVGPLWQRIWKVEEPVTIEGTVELASNNIVIDEPVSIDDNQESITVDDGDGSITVDNGITPLEVTLADPIEIDAIELTFAPSTEIRLPGEVITVYEGTLNTYDPPVTASYYISPKDVSGYKKLYIYIENEIYFGFEYTWDLLDTEGSTIRSVSNDPIEYLVTGSYCIELDVVANGIEFKLWKNPTTAGEVNIHIYASPV